MRAALCLMLAGGGLGGCATVKTLDAAKEGAPVVYAGTRLDWYAIQGGCCPEVHFGTLPPTFPSLDLPASALLDTLLLPISLLVSTGGSVHLNGGL
ncbi:YceK/YidQ family lipoprotein [Pseudomonas sp. 5P_3.1_Bac2]|uniref:YceK/YidQ family lipoprotein n=1 Tax=Pseudomonas sp. 5P_3.1_Bac2 TaxID=2971617 RepID=UPI0021C6BB22|nr:YceK/YidQ family lipoprotein [Pseudomonas sp. 5P_3.1_Bac2]MCU1715579.1 YceK/YidQ family lipoprotein [Pseudomonas sp. 5P_3.1_Bac2]